MNTESFDVIVVGAGIVGLAHAYAFAKRGKSVLVCERNPQAVGASIRNFGMVWPIGQPPGEMRQMALESREIWADLLRDSGIWHSKCGSLHLAYDELELQVLEEFHDRGQAHGYVTEMLSPGEAVDRSHAIQPQGLLGALWSASEIVVDPRETVRQLPAYLKGKWNVSFRFGTAVTAVDTEGVIAAGERLRCDQVVICSGDDFETLLPEVFAGSGLTRCKLQMLRARWTGAVTGGGPHLCAGLTLKHYANFQICPSLPNLIEQFERRYPDQVKWGIHGLVSQFGTGEVTLGDSHEYGAVVDPFLSEEIDQAILDYLRVFLKVDDLKILERWHGVYAKHPSMPFVRLEPLPGVTVATGVGGAGMTLSFGFGESTARLRLGDLAAASS